MLNFIDDGAGRDLRRCGIRRKDLRCLDPEGGRGEHDSYHPAMIFFGA